MKSSLSSLLLAVIAAAGTTAFAADWTTTGNTGTNPATNFVGTKDNQPLEIRANNKRVWRAEPTSYGDSVNIIAGAASNTAASGLRGVTIAGGGHSSNFNSVDSSFATIGGGLGHSIELNSSFSLIAGGEENTIEAGSSYSTIAGGGRNRIGTGAVGATIAGGTTNKILADAYDAFIAGGSQNVAKAPYTFAAGNEAQASHIGAFVWADTPEENYVDPYSSTAPNQFCIRARGGVHLSKHTSLNFGNQVRQMINLWHKDYGIGVQTNTQYFRTASTFAWYQGGVHNDNYINAGGGKTLMLLNTGGLAVNGTFINKSDCNAKENFAAVDSKEILAKVIALPISRWNYKDDEAKSVHVGPMAQDFYAAFKLGADDKHIATVDADGIALAAIQALHAELKQKDAQIAALKSEARSTSERLRRLEAMIGATAKSR